ncbi:MAG TPA: hypothetical protein VIO57_07970 [Chloroflexota bacterium]
MSSELKVPRLLAAKELAVTLNVPLWRICELVDDGKAPPSMRIGKTLRFPEDGVVQCIREQSNQKVSAS